MFYFRLKNFKALTIFSIDGLFLFDCTTIILVAVVAVYYKKDIKNDKL